MKILYISPENTVGTLCLWKRQHEAKGNTCRTVTFFSSPKNFDEDICLHLPFNFTKSWLAHARHQFYKLYRGKLGYRKEKFGFPPAWSPEGKIDKWFLLLKEQLWKPQIIKAIEQHNLYDFDVVHFESGMDFFKDSSFAAELKRRGVKIICHYHGEDLRTRGVMPELDAISDLNLTNEVDLLKKHPNIHYLFLKSEIGQFIVKISSYLRTVQALKEFDLNNYFKNIKKNNNKNKLNKTDYLANIPLLRIKELYSPTEKSWLEAWNLTESIIKLMNREIENKGAKMVVVTASTPIQVYPDASVRKSFISKNGNLDLFYPDKRIKKLGKKENFKVINLAQILKDYAEKNQVFFHGFDNTELGTGHWNIKGHNAAGEIISNELCNTFSH